MSMIPDSMKSLLLAFLLCFFSFSCWSQGEGNIWITGDGWGLDFNNSALTPITSATVNNVSTVTSGNKLAHASVCDATGNLLFYTDGLKVWNKNHQVMPNGILKQSGNDTSYLATSKGVVITSVPGALNKYYVFAACSWNLSLTSQIRTKVLHYSIVDMSLDNGLGDIMTGVKAIEIERNTYTEFNWYYYPNGPLTLVEPTLAAIRKDCNTIWLMVGDAHFDVNAPGYAHPAFRFRGYKVSLAGVSPSPVVSTSNYVSWPPKGSCSGSLCYVLSQIVFSKDGTKMAAAFRGSAASPGGMIELYDIDAVSGQLASCIRFGPADNSLAPYHGDNYTDLCFSPDGSKLYAIADGKDVFDLSVLVQYDISLSPVAAIDNSRTLLDTSMDWTTRISELKCGPDNRIYYLKNYCLGPPSTCPDKLNWITFPNLGGIAAQIHNDTMIVGGLLTRRILFPAENVIQPIDADTVYNTICAALSGDSLILPVDMSGYNYTWHTGDTGTRYVATAPGIYIAGYVTGCRWRKDTFVVIGAPQIHDTCADQSYARAPLVPGAGAVFTYTWRDGLGAILRQHQGNGDTLWGLPSGNYQLQVTGPSGCSVNFSFQALTRPSPDASFELDSIACTGQPVIYSNNKGPRWHWDFGDGQTATIPAGQHIYTQPGTYTVTLTLDNAQCRAVTSKTIEIKELNLQLSADKDIYYPAESLTLTTTATVPYVITTWLPVSLFTDSTALSQNLKATGGVTYHAVGISNEGCIDTASITIIVRPVIPNTFSPNGDGLNDFFRPANPGMLISSFHIYNRFGQLVWNGLGETANQGWDGTYNGASADVGTYFWYLKAKTPDGLTESLKGDVILMR